ncbi:MAG: gamma-glutamylcyclotransferase family protein [Bacteroidia bacterium]|nr:gamma-glutamylcyclotransferase family protein [Bacteroidia bacterium]
MLLFFYGLFMDIDILAKNGVNPTNPRKAYLEDYALKIGTRASLIPAKGERAYGLLMSLEKEAVTKLYAEASVSDYLAEEVEVVIENQESRNAICYNLPQEALSGTNASYAKALYALARQLDFPEDYLAKIKKMTSSEA